MQGDECLQYKKLHDSKFWFLLIACNDIEDTKIILYFILQTSAKDVI